MRSSSSSFCLREWTEDQRQSESYQSYKHSWTDSRPRLDGEGVLRYDMTAHSDAAAVVGRRVH